MSSPDLLVDILDTEGLGIFPDDQGTVTIRVTNRGDAQVNGPVTLNLYASVDSNLDLPLNNLVDEIQDQDELQGTDEILGMVTSQQFNLASGQSQTLTLDFARLDNLRTASVVSPGAYYLIAQIDSNNLVIESDENNNFSSEFVSTDGANVVLDWNATLLNAIVVTETRPVSDAPFAARNQAIVNAAIYDAVNAIDRSHTPYAVNIDASEAEGASLEAAVVGAAYQTLMELYPAESRTFQEQLLRSLDEIPDGDSEDRGFALGVRVADEILELRSNDGSANADGPYTPENGLSEWRPTPLLLTDDFENFERALLPQWGDVTPFAIPSVEDVLEGTGVDGPPEYGSAQYLEELNEVQVLGERRSTVRTAEQTEIAQFWSLQRRDSFGAQGHFNEIAQEVALEENLSVADTARLFALLNIAQADAGIVAWDVKYNYAQLRPITAIRQTSDSNWSPLLPSPPFPDYISGHATFGATSGQILARFFGDDYNFSIPSQELPGIYRSYTSFTQAADEDGISRLYGGVHVRSSIEDGLTAGRAVANYVFDNFLV